MRFSDLLSLAYANLKRNRTRSIMTLVGVGIGVAALLALVSYGAGLQKNAQAEVDALDLYNTLRVTSSPMPFASPGEFAFQDARPDSVKGETVALTDALVDSLDLIDGVLAAYPEVLFPTKILGNDREVFAHAEAIPQGFATLEGFRPTEGRYPAATDSALLVAPSLARRLGYENPSDLVGQTVELAVPAINFGALMSVMSNPMTASRGTVPIMTEAYNFEVAGLLPEKDQAVSGFFRVLMPIETAQQLKKVSFFSAVDLLMNRGPAGSYPALRVQLDGPESFDSVRRAIEAKGVYVTSFRDQFAQLERLFLIMDLALGIIGFIALLVATIGIANTMMMNVIERKQEIGVMKAVGGEESDLQKLFVAESALLGLSGGILGLLGGFAVTALLNLGVNAYVARFGMPPIDAFHTPPLMAIAILGIALAVSLAAGVAPARRASRIAPIEALRA
jgi:putative ABC transport system permease protein